MGQTEQVQHDLAGLISWLIRSELTINTAALELPVTWNNGRPISFHEASYTFVVKGSLLSRNDELILQKMYPTNLTYRDLTIEEAKALFETLAGRARNAVDAFASSDRDLLADADGDFFFFFSGKDSLERVEGVLARSKAAK